MRFRPDREATFTFHFTEAPAVESTWCLDNCPLERPGRCCAQYRPHFGLFDLMLLHYLDQSCFRFLLEQAGSTLQLTSPYLMVEARNHQASCNLWTPEGCRLPVTLRSTTCRTYFCRPSVFGGTPELRETNDRWIEVLQTVSDTQDCFAEWAAECTADYRRRNHNLCVSIGQEVSTAENAVARDNLLEFTEHHQPGFKRYLKLVRGLVAHGMGNGGAHQILKVESFAKK